MAAGRSPLHFHIIDANSYMSLTFMADPAGKKPESSSNVPGTVFSMPLLPQSSPLHDATSSAEVTSSAAATGAEVTEVGEDLQLGYRGLLEDKDDDDKVWDNFTSTIEAVRLAHTHQSSHHVHVSTSDLRVYSRV